MCVGMLVSLCVWVGQGQLVKAGSFSFPAGSRDGAHAVRPAQQALLPTEPSC